MSTYNNYLTCKGVRFYSRHDEDIFFEWISQIKIIEKFEGARDELYLDLANRELEYEDLKDLLALLARYKVDLQQLQPFITEKNKAAAEPWKKQIYKAKKTKNNDTAY